MMEEYKAMIVIKNILDKLSIDECQRVFAWINALVAQKEDKGEESWE